MTWQERVCNNKWFRVTVSVVLTVAVLLVFVLSPFAQAHAIVGATAATVTIVIAALAAMGITFATTGAFDNVGDFVADLLNQYAIDNNVTFNSLFNNTKYSVNAAGKILLNNRFVTLIDTFAQWIVGKYNLTNNNNVTVQNIGAYLDGKPVFPLPYSVYRIFPNRNWEFLFIETSGEQEVYAANVLNSSQTSINVHLFSLSSFTSTFIIYKNGEVYDTQNYAGSYDRTTGWYTVINTGTYDLVPEDSRTLDDCIGYNEFQPMLRASQVVDYNNIGVGIDVGEINLPSDNLDYTQGDGAILDVGASWGETTGGAIATVPDIWPEWLPQTETLTENPEITIAYEAEAVLEEALPGPTDVENIPGAALPLLDEDGHIQNLSFSSLWHYVAQWISDMTSGAAVVWNVATLAPSPVVNMLYAMIVLAMFFGAVKVFR